MYRRKSIVLVLGVVFLTSSASAQEPSSIVESKVEITYEGALTLARTQAPALAAARERVSEAKSRSDAAAIWRFNPELAAAAGPRVGPDATTFDWSISAQQWLEVGGQRNLRSEAAGAGVVAAGARRANAQRLLLRDVSRAFIAALYWQRRVVLADENVALAADIARITARRHEVGDVGGLEESVAALAAIRASTDADRVRAMLIQAQGRLKALLGINAATDVACRGELRQLVILEPAALDVAMPEGFVPSIANRPDLRALEAEIAQAKANAALGRAGRIPNFAVGVGYAHEESADILRGTMTVALPVFDRGQGTTMVAEARRRRLRSDIDAAAHRAAIEAGTAWAMAEQLGAASHRFEQEGLAPLERSERLAVASYEAGAIPLGELLVVRRELVQAKLDYAELLVGAATARAEWAAHTGALQ